MKIIYICLLMTLLTGCSMGYNLEKEGNVKATIVMADELQETSNNFYHLYPQNSCRNEKDYGLAANMNTAFGGRDRVVYLRPNKRVFILADSKIHSGQMTYNCTNYVSFLPKSGKEYLLKQSVKLTNCDLRISDTLTGNPASSIREEVYPEDCPKVNKRVLRPRIRVRYQ